MRKILPVAAALVLALAGCSSGKKAEKPAEEPAAVEDAVEAEEVDQGATLEWVSAKTADEAAKIAGFDRFGVVSSFKLGDLDFAEPTFAAAGGVAQATYETPATMVVLRKGVDNYTAPLSDRDTNEFAASWNKVYEGTPVACYGPAKGAITVATWTDGAKSYGLTFQGLGGEEMTMDSDELAALVKGINEANADQDQVPEQTKTEEQAKQEEEAQKSDETPLLSAARATALVEQACGGTCSSVNRVTTRQYGECWYITASDANGNYFEYYVNNYGVYLIDEKGAQKEGASDEHTEGEPVTIYDSIYAEWHQANGEWYATFVTYNGTQIFAQTAPAGGGWVFFAFTEGRQVQVIYSDEEMPGPNGVPSHWVELDGEEYF